MATAREQIPYLLRKAQEKGFKITLTMLSDLSAKEIWRAVSALYHGTTPRLFLLLDPDRSYKQTESSARSDDYLRKIDTGRQSITSAHSSFWVQCPNPDCRKTVHALDLIGTGCPYCR